MVQFSGQRVTSVFAGEIYAYAYLDGQMVSGGSLPSDFAQMGVALDAGHLAEKSEIELKIKFVYLGNVNANEKEGRVDEVKIIKM